MIEQTIIQAALSSIETFDGTKSEFEAWTESGENAEQISGQEHYIRHSPKCQVLHFHQLID